MAYLTNKTKEIGMNIRQSVVTLHRQSDKVKPKEWVLLVLINKVKRYEKD